MKNVLQILCLLLVLNAVAVEKQRTLAYESELLEVVQISKNVFRHTSYLHSKSYGKIGCNGMVFFQGDEAIVFDTPVNDEASVELLDWIGEKKIKAVVVTHFHVDCLGGLAEFHARNVPSYATRQTIALAEERGKEPLPKNGFDERKEFRVGNELVHARYFGEGHTKDNIIGYIPSEKTLFGGCLVKAVNAPEGNLADATPSDWPQTIKRLKEEVSDVEVVIPGHGRDGGTELLDYTIQLFSPYNERFLFFLHNRFLENHGLEELHPQFGRAEYEEIIAAFENDDLTVISEKRNGNVNAREYATKVVQQIDSLLDKGVPAGNITVVGTSKGGYIAQYVSTLTNNPELNFVFIASFQASDIERIPEINYCGNILAIYEKTDPYGVSAVERKQQSTCTIDHFREIELNTGMGHGFLFKPLKEWMEPTIRWAHGNYEME